MASDRNLPTVGLGLFLYYYRSSLHCTWNALYNEWISKNTIHGYTLAQLTTIKDSLDQYQAANRWQGLRIILRLWYRSGFASLPYYRNLLTFKAALTQLTNGRQALSKAEALKRSRNPVNWLPGKNGYDELIKTYHPDDLILTLDEYGPKLEGFFSKIIRHIKIWWERRQMHRGLEEGDGRASIAQRENKEENQEAKAKPRAHETAVSFRLQLSNWSRRRSNTPMIYHPRYLQTLSKTNLNKMQALRYAGRPKVNIGYLFGLCARKARLEELHNRYQKRYKLSQWELASDNDEIKRNTELQQLNAELDFAYEDVLKQLLPLIQDGLATYLKNQFQKFTLCPDENHFIKLKKNLDQLIKKTLFLSKDKQPFYDNHLCLLLRQALKDMRMQLSGFTAAADQRIINKLANWLRKTENQLTQSITREKVDKSAEILAALDCRQLTESCADARKEIKKTCLDESRDLESRARSVYALRAEWNNRATAVEALWQAHQWDEEDPVTAAWKSGVFCDFTRIRKSESEAIDETIQKNSPQVAEWIIENSRLVPSKAGEARLECGQDESIFEYIFACSFFDLDWSEPLRPEDVRNAYRSLSLQCHPDKAPACDAPRVNAAQSDVFSVAFDICKKRSEKLTKLLKDQKALLQASEVMSPMLLDQVVDAGHRHRERVLDEVMQVAKDTIETQREREAHYRRQAAHRAGREAAKRQISDAEKQIAEATKQAADSAKQATDSAKQAADSAKQATDSAKQAADSAKQAAEEKAAREAAEQEVERLRKRIEDLERQQNQEEPAPKPGANPHSPRGGQGFFQPPKPDPRPVPPIAAAVAGAAGAAPNRAPPPIPVRR